MPYSLPQGVQITWLGHATVLVKTPEGKRLLIDPFLQGNPSCPETYKNDIGPIDLLLITHGHGDHTADMLPVAQKTGCAVVAIFELAEYLQSKGVSAEKVTGMGKGGTIRLNDLSLSITMTNAFHSSSIEEGDTVIYVGEPAGFVVTLDSGFTFYAAGDTCVFSDMAIIAELYQPQLAILPIGDHYTMGVKEAGLAVKFLDGIQAVLPIHYGTFPLLIGNPEGLRLELEKRGLAVEVLEPQPGETLKGV